MRGLFFIVNTKDTFDLELARKAILGGVDGIQWRHKGAFSKEFMDFGFALKKLCHESKITFLVNDRPDIALILDADGVHLGQTDLPIQAARKILSEKKLIGATASTLQEAKKALEEGADYISMGHIFATKTKEKTYPPIGTEILIQIVREIPLPIFAIGGITRQNAADVIKTGVAGIAVISAIVGSNEPYEETKKIKALL